MKRDSIKSINLKVVLAVSCIVPDWAAGLFVLCLGIGALFVMVCCGVRLIRRTHDKE